MPSSGDGLVQGNLLHLLGHLVFPEADDGFQDGQATLIETIDHHQFLCEKQIAKLSLILPQRLDLESVEQSKLREPHKVMAIDVDGLVTQSLVFIQQFLIILGHRFLIAFLQHGLLFLDDLG